MTAARGQGLTLEIAGGVRIVVPDDPRRLSTYVLLEQEDWFEDEIAFIRRVAAPGGCMLDIGASLGIYGLSYACAAGPDSRVWAFEPTPAIAALARRSAVANALSGFELIETALGARNGRAGLDAGDESELNRLASSGTGIEVAVARLDDVVAERRIGRVDVVKIDVEGAEAAVIEGGRDFFMRETPLVMLEVRAGDQGCDFAALDRLAALGYAAYRLVPELGLIAPFARESIDPFLLNLFACKSDRAAHLAERGLLASRDDAPAASITRTALEQTLVAMPVFGLHASAIAGLSARQPAGDPALDMLLFYLAALDSRRPAASRLASFRAAASCAHDIGAASQSSAVRLMSAARILRGWGDRAAAAGALQRLMPALLARTAIRVDAPFLAPLAAYDAWTGTQGLSAWFNAGIIEAIGSFGRFSSYFHEPFPQPVADMLRPFGRATAPLERQRQLRRIVDGAQPGPEAHPLLRESGLDNLNPGFWCGAIPSGGYSRVSSRGQRGMG